MNRRFGLIRSRAGIVDAVAPPACPHCERGHLIAKPRLSPQQLAAIIVRLDSS